MAFRSSGKDGCASCVLTVSESGSRSSLANSRSVNGDNDAHRMAISHAFLKEAKSL